VVALGPMTNLAVACRLDEDFARNVKELVWMGGTMYGKGNHTFCAEFNVAADPEAAHAVWWAMIPYHQQVSRWLLCPGPNPRPTDPS
jgi:inosine-uridine nucleoside N-ribohydrolase